MAPDYEVLEHQLQTANQRLSETRRGLQANGQRVIELESELAQVRPVADAAHEFCAATLRPIYVDDPEKTRRALLAAHRATTPSSTPATHVVIAVDELVELKRLKDDHYQAGYDDGWGAGIESAERE